MSDDLQDQAALAANFEAAIASIEGRLTVAGNAVTAPQLDAAAEGLDSDTVQQLMDSLQSANDQVADGEIALADIGFAAGGQANA